MDYFNQHSERLTFRKCSLEDIPVWSEFFHDRSRLPWLGLDPEKDPALAAEDWIRRQLERYEVCGLGHLAATLKVDGRLIGMGGVIPRTLDGKEQFEVAYSLIPEFRGNGYASEIASKMVEFARGELGFSRLISIIHTDNESSKRVTRNAGMEFWKRTKYNDIPVHVYASIHGIL